MIMMMVVVMVTVISPPPSNISEVLKVFFWTENTDQHSNMEIHHLYFSKNKGILLIELLRHPERLFQ